MKYFATLSLLASAASAIPQAEPSVGQAILDVAMTAAGTPYAWGGGTCDGPSDDQPPYDYGDIGYDCSGLVSWAVCQVTGRDLFTEGLRVTSSMYCADEATLGYKKYPFEERLPGDAVFFGGACDCGTSGSIHHVGLMMYGPNYSLHQSVEIEDADKYSRDSGDRMWNAPNDDVNAVQENSISGFGETACPYVIRFT